MTLSSTLTSRLPASCFPTRCCSGRTSLRATGGASTRSTATASARLTTTCRAPARSPWRRSSRRSACCGTPLRDQRVVDLWSGHGGHRNRRPDSRCHGARGLVRKSEATRRFWCVDRQGLLTAGHGRPAGRPPMAYARPAAESKGWKHGGNGNRGWLGRSGEAGETDDADRRVDRFRAPSRKPSSGKWPRILSARSSFRCRFRASRAEANPADLLAWTERTRADRHRQPRSARSRIRE